MVDAGEQLPPRAGELVRGVLPAPRTIAPPLWAARHRALLWLLAAHAAVLPAWGWARHGLSAHLALEAAALLGCLGVGLLARNRTAAASAVSVGLVLSAALLVHSSDGRTVLHFHFFLVVAALALYKQLLPFGLALVLTLADHLVLGLRAPEAVYDDAFSLASPWTAAAVHAAYVLAAGALAAVAWAWADRERRDAEERADHEAGRVRDSERRLTGLLDHAPSSIFVKDLDGRFVTVNRHFAQTMRRPAEQLVGRTSAELFGVGALETVQQHDAEVVATRRARTQVERNVVGYGEDRAFSVLKFPLLDDDGRVTAIAGIATDITERLDADAALRASEERLRRVFESGPLPQLVLTAEGVLAQVNPALCRLFGYDEDQLLGVGLGWLVDPRDRAQLDELRVHAADGLGAAAGGARAELRMLTKDGAARQCRLTLAVVDVGGAPPQLVGMVEDVTAVRRSAAALAHQAHHDALTGLPNRVVLLRSVACGLEQEGGAAALLFLDLDGFKEVNDSLGHDAGDALLRVVAARLEQVRRPADTLARFGGDEFVLCAEGVVDRGAAYDIAERMLAALRAPVLVGDQRVEVRGSVGIALGRAADGATPALLLRDADTALYAAKGGGRDRVVVFEPYMRERDELRRRLQGDLSAVLRGGSGLRLVFQPVAVAATGRVVTCEALVRWDHPTDGLLMPEDFLALAGDKGLLPELDRWVLGEACRVAAGWPTRGGEVSVAVNLAPRSAADGDLVDWVDAACRASGLPPHRLLVELTETAVVERPVETSRTLGRLRARGVRVALDDFGTGFSSLSHLRDLPVDVVKIDRSFTVDAGRSARDGAIVRAVADLADALGAGLVAEGVETEAQQQAVVAAGCEQVQGWHVSRELSAHAVGELLKVQAAAPAPAAVYPQRAGAAVVTLR